LSLTRAWITLEIACFWNWLDTEVLKPNVEIQMEIFADERCCPRTPINQLPSCEQGDLRFPNLISMINGQTVLHSKILSGSQIQI
jgi:hypothetical protein